MQMERKSCRALQSCENYMRKRNFVYSWYWYNLIAMSHLMILVIEIINFRLDIVVER